MKRPTKEQRLQINEWKRKQGKLPNLVRITARSITRTTNVFWKNSLFWYALRAGFRNTCHIARNAMDQVGDEFVETFYFTFGSGQLPLRFCDLRPLDYFCVAAVKEFIRWIPSGKLERGREQCVFRSFLRVTRIFYTFL